MTPVGISDALFSTVQRRVLALIFGRPERSYYMSEIIRRIGSGTGAVERELSRLQRSGIISMERIGNQKHYRANLRSPIFHELQGIVRKTFGLREPVRQALVPFASRIRAAFIYGSVARETDTASSDIDLIVIGDDLSYSELFGALNEVENIVQRPINITILSFEEWQKRRAQKNAFHERVANNPRMFIIGSEDDLENGEGGTGQSGRDREN